MVKHEQQCLLFCRGRVPADPDFLQLSLKFSVISLGEGQKKLNERDSCLFLVACCRGTAQSHVTGMTDALLGMLAERKCLQKGGAGPKCNTKVLSCCCRTSASVVHVNIVRWLR